MHHQYIIAVVDQYYQFLYLHIDVHRFKRVSSAQKFGLYSASECGFRFFFFFASFFFFGNEEALYQSLIRRTPAPTNRQRTFPAAARARRWSRLDGDDGGGGDDRRLRPWYRLRSKRSVAVPIKHTGSLKLATARHRPQLCWCGLVALDGSKTKSKNDDAERTASEQNVTFPLFWFQFLLICAVRAVFELSESTHPNFVAQDDVSAN